MVRAGIKREMHTAETYTATPGSKHNLTWFQVSSMPVEALENARKTALPDSMHG
jgi:hypothetical protein